MSQAKLRLAQTLAGALKQRADTPRPSLKRARDAQDPEIIADVEMLMRMVDRYVVEALLEQLADWRAQAKVQKRHGHWRAIEWMRRDLRRLATEAHARAEVNSHEDAAE